MKYVWMLRHGESTAQTEEELGIDTGLSKLGHEQAVAAGQVLAGITFDQIYVSPLNRTRETFESAGLPRDKVVFDSRLVENMPAGGYDDLLPYQLQADYGSPIQHHAWSEESFRRSANFLQDLQTQVFKRILLVSHTGLLSDLVQQFLGCREERPVKSWFKYCAMANAGISVIAFKETEEEPGRDSLLAWNDTRHLTGLITSSGFDPMYPEKRISRE